MKIAVFGLGYVGCVSAACLADMGHSVIGVDVNPSKIEMIRQGKAPIIEDGLDEMLARVIAQGRLNVTTCAVEAVVQSEISMVCVGTPSRSNGSLDTGYIERVMQEIGEALAIHSEYHIVVSRSTLLPGIFQETILPLLETASGKKAGEAFGVCVNPEFLRESTAIKDFQAPPFTVIGELNKQSGDALAQVYSDLPAPIYRVEPEEAAMVKYASNTFHALKVGFANELGAMCNNLRIDSHRVMGVFSQDKNLNISAAYLRPGFAFGGSCLPKDVRALLYAAKHRDIDMPLISSILPSNDLHIQRAVDLLSTLNKKRVTLLGLSFKPGTDDLRESPLVRLAETLIGKGYHLSIYDEEVVLSSVFGRNREYIEHVLPHINELLRTNLSDLLDESEVLIVGKSFNKIEKFRSQLREDHIIVDLTRSENWFPAQHMYIV